MRGKRLNEEEVRIVLTISESEKIREWLQESFNLLEIGGQHRIKAVNLAWLLEIIEKNEL